MKRAFWGKAAVVVAAALAIMTLPACDDSFKINVDRAVLFPVATNRGVPAAIPIELAYDEFEVPANVPGTLRVEFTSGTRYTNCTLNFDGSYLIEVRQDGGGYYVERQVSGMVPGRRASGSLTCIRPTGVATPFSDTFTIVVRDAGGLVAARPLEVYFGSVAVGSVVAGDMVIVTNLGPSSVSIPTLQLTGPDSGSFRIKGQNCQSGALRPGRQCAVVLEFACTREGVATADLVIRTLPARPTDAVHLVGTGIPAPKPALSVSTSRVDFGDVTIGESRSTTVTVSNSGSADLLIPGITLAGVHVAPTFALTSDNCSARPLAPGLSCTVAVVFRPDSQGRWTVELRITSNAANEPRVVRITGSGIAAPAPTPTPTPTATPACDPYHYPYC